MKYPGKRFTFAIIAVICATVTTIYLKYAADMYWKILLTICGVFTTSQTLTDMKGDKNGTQEVVGR